MRSKQNPPVRQVSLKLEGDAAILLDALVALVKKKERELHKAPVTQSEIAGAIITAYVVEHAEDILEAITDEAERLFVEGALRSHSVRTGLPRAHRSRGIRAPRISNGGAAASTRIGGEATSARPADRDQAAE